MNNIKNIIPLEKITQTIEDAIGKGAYEAAFFCALTIPDICGAMAYPEIEGTGSKYREWYNQYLYKYENPEFSEDELERMSFSTPYNVLDGEILYLIRCKMFHEGTLNHEKIYSAIKKKYKKKYPEKEIRLEVNWYSEQDRFGLSESNMNNIVFVSVNVDRVILTKKLMWIAQKIINDFYDDIL